MQNDQDNSIKNWENKVKEKLKQPNYSFSTAEGLVSLFESFNQFDWEVFLQDLALKPSRVQLLLQIQGSDDPDIYIQPFLKKTGQQTYNLLSLAIEKILQENLLETDKINERNEIVSKSVLFLASSASIPIKSIDILKKIILENNLPVHLRFHAASIIRNQKEKISRSFWKQIAVSRNSFELAPIIIAILSNDSPLYAIEFLKSLKSDHKNNHIFKTPLRILLEELFKQYYKYENSNISTESFPKWIRKDVEELLTLDYFRELKNKLEYQKKGESSIIIKAAHQLFKDNKSFQNNIIVQKLVENSIADLDKQLKVLALKENIFSFPLELYPRHLLYLQHQLKETLTVKAVAIIEDVERFWANDDGSEIGKTTNCQSERLFVFLDEDKYNKSAKFLLDHASRYTVYVTTLETYLPLAQEFSIRDKLSQWQTEDHSLPTKEYAIFETTDGSHLLLWYDEENIKGSSDKRLANCSAIQEQAFLYKEAFELLKKAQGVFEFSVTPETVVDSLEQLKKGLFQQHRIYKYHLTPQRLLEDLQSIRNKLISLNSKNEIIESALRIVRKKLYSQTASIFLHSKDGLYYRVKIEGVDVNGNTIQNKWFAEEKYFAGESFTGKAVLSGKNGYGQPQLSNNLDESEVDNKSKTKYKNKLGNINCAMAVPLNGHNKTFGVLEIINKVDINTGKPLQYCGFNLDEIYYLSAIGSFIANAISNYRRDKQTKLYTDLAEFLIESPQEPKITYHKAAKRLISPETAFKACIIRVKQESNLLEIQGFDIVEDIKIKERRNKPIKIGIGLAGKTFQKRNPIIIPVISEEIQKFNNKKWIKTNGLISFACFPLIYLDEVVGTLSVYTGYEYDFHPSCQKFLFKVASLIAAFIGRIKEKKKEQDKDNYIKDEILPTLPQEKQKEVAKTLDNLESISNENDYSENSVNENLATTTIFD